MTLRPIQGAPTDAPIPDFPTGEPTPLVVPPSRSVRRPVGPLEFSLPPSTPMPPPMPARRHGPLEIRGGDSTLTFRCIPERPAISRASMTISIAGGPVEDQSPRAIPHLELATDEARAFLLALRDGEPPVVIADRSTTFQLEFAIAEDGPTFIVRKPGQEHTARKFNAGRSFDVKAMAEHLLADLGP